MMGLLEPQAAVAAGYFLVEPSRQLVQVAGIPIPMCALPPAQLSDAMRCLPGSPYAGWLPTSCRAGSRHTGCTDNWSTPAAAAPSAVSSASRSSMSASASRYPRSLAPQLTANASSAATDHMLQLARAGRRWRKASSAARKEAAGCADPAVPG